MTVWRNIPLKRAERYAEQFRQMIREDCLTVIVAGEVRRKQTVTSSPIEVVAAPIMIEEHNLFEEALPPTNLLMQTVQRMLGTVRLDERVEGKRKRKEINEWPMKLLFRADSGMLCPIDLWMVTEATFGAVLALRTGPYGLRSRLMTSNRSLSASGGAGLLHPEMQLSEKIGLVDRDTGETLWTPTENMFFEILELRMLPPEERR